MHHFLNGISTYIASLGELGQSVMTALISMLPVIELRGSLPIAAAAGLPWYFAYFAAVIGNLLPVPFVLLFCKRVVRFLKTRSGAMKRFASFLERKVSKNRSKIEKFEMFGLALFVAIPLPGTGAWTGAIVASLIDMRFKKAFAPIAVGVGAAGIVVGLLSYGVRAVVTN